MNNQPHIKQKESADTMGITIQAISKYFKKLTKEGLLEAGSGRADYHLTPKAMGKLHDDLKGLERYVTFIKSQIKIEHAWPAIATQPVKAGQTVALIVKEGVMYTVDPNSPAAELKGVDFAKVQTLYDDFKPDRIAVMGAVGRAVLNKLKLKADIEFGISRDVAIAASRGLNVFVLVVGRMTNRMTQEIDNVNMKSAANISYE